MKLIICFWIYFRWEKDRAALLACENLVDLLIRTEEEIGAEDLHSVEIPDDLIPKLEKMDSSFLEEEEEEEKKKIT
jgi:hypothetical protein